MWLCCVVDYTMKYASYMSMFPLIFNCLLYVTMQRTRNILSSKYLLFFVLVFSLILEKQYIYLGHFFTQFFTGRMPFLPPNQQRQSTEGTDRQTGIYSMTLSTRGHAVPTGTSITLSTDRHTQ